MTKNFKAFPTTPIDNIIQDDADTHQAYYQYMSGIYRAQFLRGERSVQTAKRILGKQNYTHTFSLRNWVWERPFEVDLGGGRLETWHWRLFASRAGFSLEVEVRGPWFNNPDMLVVAKAALESFKSTWDAAVKAQEAK